MNDAIVEHNRERLYRCAKCGHEQWVFELVRREGIYAGSGQNWCDRCGNGKPEPTDSVRSARDD